MIPLMRAFFFHKEIGKLVQGIISSPTASKEELGAFIYFMGPHKFRKQFMKQEGIPFFVWWVGGFSTKFNYYSTEVASQVDALKSGTPSPPKPRPWLCC